VVDVRDVLEARPPAGRIVVVDELASTRRPPSPSCWPTGLRVEVVTNGWWWPDLGITLDLETWNVKAHALGIVSPSTWSDGVSRPDDGGPPWPCSSSTIPPARPGATLRLVVCAVHQEPEDDLWRALDGAPFEVHRIGDCLARAGPCRRDRGEPRGGVTVSRVMRTTQDPTDRRRALAVIVAGRPAPVGAPRRWPRPWPRGRVGDGAQAATRALPG